MPTWPDDLKIEEARIRVLYKLLHGLPDKDIRDLHIPGDVRTKLNMDLEIKGWNRNGWLPLETHSVLEKQKRGWAWASTKLNVWFVRVEKKEALGISMEAIRSFLENTGMHRVIEIKCACGRAFMIREHQHPLIIKQEIQWSNHKEYHKYHSACLFVDPEAFPMADYLGRYQKEAAPPAATTTAPPKGTQMLTEERTQILEIWQRSGRPAIPLRQGEVCRDLEKFLSCSNIRDSDTQALRAWAQNKELL